MLKKTDLRFLSALVAMALLLFLMPLSASAAENDDAISEESFEQRAIITPLPIDYIKWGDNISGTSTSGHVLVGQTRLLEDMGLHPKACANGTVNSSFTWSSANTAVATVNADTGAITGVSAGTAVITGISPFGSSHGQLTLVVFVTDMVRDITFMGVAGICTTGDCVNDHYLKSTVIEDLAYQMGYDLFVLRSSMTSSTFAAYVATSRMVCFRNHGTQTSLYVNNEPSKRAYVDLISSLPNGSLAYCELAVIASNYSGRGGANATNIVNALHQKGVGTVVGITSDISCEELNDWIEGLYYFLYEGYTVEQACQLAAEEYIAWEENVFDEVNKHTCTNDCTDRCTGYHVQNYYIKISPNAG